MIGRNIKVAVAAGALVAATGTAFALGASATSSGPSRPAIVRTGDSTVTDPTTTTSSSTPSTTAAPVVAPETTPPTVQPTSPKPQHDVTPSNQPAASVAHVDTSARVVPTPSGGAPPAPNAVPPPGGPDELKRVGPHANDPTPGSR